MLDVFGDNARVHAEVQSGQQLKLPTLWQENVDLQLVRAGCYLLELHCESKKNCATFIFTVTLANVGRFLKFFQCRNQKEVAHNKNEKFATVA